MPTGTLYLIPASLGEAPQDAIRPAGVQRIVQGLTYFIVENAKTARAELKRIGIARALQDIRVEELPREPGQTDLDALLAPIVAGQHAGVMSEAGAPAVADPGALLVRAAYAKNIRVTPLVGPSSLLLALMASGLNGQNFAFHGYLPVREPERSKRISELERESHREQRTQIFIETPYRNSALFAALVKTCRPDTLLCLASALTTAEEKVETKRMQAWRTCPPPALDKRPTVFLLLAT